MAMTKSNPKSDDERTLALMLENDTMTAQDIAQALGISLQSARSAIRRLCAIGKIARAGDYARSGTPIPYRAVRSTPSWAQRSQSDVWKGTDWTAATMRPGCLDHERIPSRRGNERVPYQPPQFYATSSVAQVRAGDR